VISVSGDGEFLEGGGFGISQPDISRMEAGFPLGYFVGYQTDGVFQSQSEIDNSAVTDVPAEPGDLKFIDQNGDGVIDLDDRVDLGNPLPDATMGLNLSFDYKNWDFSAYAFASVGNEIVRNYERNQQLVNKPISYLRRWTGEGSTNTDPRVSIGATSNTVFSDYYVEDGSFVRLQNAQLGYTFNNEEGKIKKLRIYIQGNNLFTLTEYSGYDPTAGTGAPIGGGIDQGIYPSARIFLLGVNMKI
ncbi:MAG: SusC/RagA family protein, partial [Psychroserpens sp.]